MATHNTSGCSITVGGATLAGQLPDAQVSLDMSPVEVTSVGDVDRYYVPGIRGGTLSGNLYYSQDNTAVKAIETARTSGAEVTIVVTLHTGATYTGQALITNFQPGFTFNDVVKASFSAQFTGPVTISA